MQKILLKTSLDDSLVRMMEQTKYWFIYFELKMNKAQIM